MAKTSILLVDDHVMIRDIMKSYIDGLHFDISEATNGLEALEQLKVKEFDLIICDLMMPEMDGIAFTQEVRSTNPDQKIIILSMFTDKKFVKQLLKAGVAGYLSKEVGMEEIQNAINQVLTGNTYYSKAITDEIMSDFIPNPELKKRTAFEKPLTKRELDVLRLIIQEYSNEEIAEKLFISKRTVDTHKQNMLGKTGAKNIAGLVLHALERNLLDLGLNN